MTDNPADQFMILRALEYGVDAAKDVVKAELDAFRATFNVKSFDTRFGSLVCTITPASVYLSDAGLLEWARIHAPSEVVEAYDEVITVHHPATVQPAVKKRILDRAVIDGEDVIDETTGELIPFAHIKQKTEKWTPRVTDEVKADAGNAILDRLDMITGLLDQTAVES